MDKMKEYRDIDHYISEQPDERIRAELEKIRATIAQAAPNVKEVISYGMPAFKQHGVLVYFAAFKKHIGFFPTASGVEVFKDRLTEYKTSKGTIQFQLKEEIPYELITDIVLFRVAEDETKAALKKKK